MDQLFASLAISGASLVGKAAFSIATNAAVKQIQSLVGSNVTTQSSQLKSLESKLEKK